MKCGNNQGFSLIEIALALLVSGIGFMAVTGLIATGLTYSRTSKNDTIVANLAQDLLGSCRTLALLDWNSVVSGMELPGLPADLDLNTNGNFIADGTIHSGDVFGDPINYRVTITPNGANIKEILVGIFPSFLTEDPNDRLSKFNEEATWFYTELINYNGLL